MVMYKLTGRSGSIKVFRRFESKSVTFADIILDLVASIKAEFPGRDFTFEVKRCSL